MRQRDWKKFRRQIESLDRRQIIGVLSETPNFRFLHGCLGIVTEAGELADVAKKLIYYDKPIDREHVVEELGDLRWYEDVIMEVLGITDKEIYEYNYKKLQKRYGTGEFSNEQALARKDKENT